MIRMKGITCCGDCAYYNMKKHRCTRAYDEGKATDRFYADCPLPDVILKEKAPKVLTWEEIWEKKPFHAWAEDRFTGAIVFPIAFIDGEYRDAAYDWCMTCTDEHRRDYGKTYRLWTGRPSEEQREATKWE